jgi:hypothetical protein
MNFRPDLADSVLEDRCLMDASQVGPVPIALTAGGYVVSPVPSAGFSASLGTFSGWIGTAASSDMSGMAMAAGFYITSFGLSGMTIGNSNGASVLSPGGQAGTGRTHTVVSSVGSPATTDGPTGLARPNPFGQSALLLTRDSFLYIGKTVTSEVVARAPISPTTPAGPQDQSGPATAGAARDGHGPDVPIPIGGSPAHSGIVRSVRETPTPGRGSSRCCPDEGIP